MRRGLTLRNQSPTTDLSRYRSDPLGFFREVLKVSPWQKQIEIMQALASSRRVTVRACHNSGKSFLAGGLVPWWVHCFSPSLVVTTASNARQVRDVLWKEVRERQRESSLPGDLLLDRLTVAPNQRAVGFSTDDPVKMQGWHEQNILVIVDEASGVEEPIFEAIEGLLTGPNAKLLLIGNPNHPAGTFHASFMSPLYEKFHIAASDVPEWLLPPAWAAERAQEWGEDSPIYQVRVKGNFPDQGDDSLIALSWVEKAQDRDGDGTQAEDAVVIGVDVARYGSDESVAYLRRGPDVVAMDCWRGQDTLQSAGRVAGLARNAGASRILVDDIGVGGGVTDQLAATFRGSGVTVIGVNVGEAAVDSESYFNLRSEMFAGLADRFRTGDISIPKNDTKLLAQLVALKKQFTPRGQMKLESKDDMRKRLPKLGSPDRADALALAFYAGGNRWIPVSPEAPVFEPARLW